MDIVPALDAVPLPRARAMWPSFVKSSQQDRYGMQSSSRRVDEAVYPSRVEAACSGSNELPFDHTAHIRAGD